MKLAPPVLEALVLVLSLWSLLSMGAAVVGLYVGSREFWRSFWFMNGLWGFVDGAIALYSLRGTLRSAAELAPILRFNTGLDVVYLVSAAFMLTRAATRIKGFGAAVLLQGGFLLALDLYFWLKCLAVAG